MRQRISGFTLMELMVVVAIIGLLVVVAMPSIRGIGSGRGMTTAAATLNGVLNGARQEALAKNTYVAVALGEQGGALWVATFTSNNGERIDAEESLTVSGDYQLTGAPRSFERLVLKDKGELTPGSLPSPDVNAANIDSPAEAATTITVSGRSVALSRRIIFTPRGEALAGDELNQYIEFGIVSAQDGEAKDPAVFRISGNLGTVTVYRN